MTVNNSLTLLHTNDHHNHLTEAQAQHLRLRRDSVGGSGLLLDAGDAISAGNVTVRPGGEPILTRMAQAGYDAMTVGNREFHFSRPGFLCKLSKAAFPVLCANVRPVQTPAPDWERYVAQGANAPASDLPVLPYILREIGVGTRVVVFGVTVPMITERMLARTVSAYVFDDPLRTAAALVPALRRELRPDLLIALTHIGIRHDRALAAEVPGIDLIVGGHTHVVLEEGERVGETLIVQAGAKGKYVGIVGARQAELGGRWDFRARLEPL